MDNFVRSELGRQLTVTRYFRLLKKDDLTAFIYWLFLGMLGLHRFYFRDYWQAGLLILFSILVIVGLVAEPYYAIYILPILALVMVIEAILIPFRVRKINAGILNNWESKYGLK